MKRSLAPVAVLALAFAAVASPAVADSDADGPSQGSAQAAGDTLSWLQDAPDYPVEWGKPGSTLTPEDLQALAAYEAEFPWADAYASFGCDATDIVVDTDGSKSMVLDCAEATMPLDEIGDIYPTAIAAAEGHPAAVAAVETGTPVDGQELAAELSGSGASARLLAESCSNEANQRHCINNQSAPFYRVSSYIRTISGTSTGVNRLGRVGFGNPCANGTFLNQSDRVTISTTAFSLVDAPTTQSSKWSSRWTISAFSYSRYCATL